VVQLIAERRSNPNVCDQLGVGLKTGGSYRAAAMRKLGLHNTAGLVRHAIKNRIAHI
jgi:DNA-binding CsgD family transcriptional regulator